MAGQRWDCTYLLRLRPAAALAQQSRTATKAVTAGGPPGLPPANWWAAGRSKRWQSAGVKGKQAVRLELWVNGKKAAEATDADHPLPAGTVGLVVGVDQTKRVSMAEFDNFTVSRVW